MIFKNQRPTLYTEIHKCNNARNGCKYRLTIRVDEIDPTICHLEESNSHVSESCMVRRPPSQSIPMTDRLKAALEQLFTLGYTPDQALDRIIPLPVFMTPNGDWNLGVSPSLQCMILELSPQEKMVATRPHLHQFWTALRAKTRISPEEAYRTKKNQYRSFIWLDGDLSPPNIPATGPTNNIWEAGYHFMFGNPLLNRPDDITNSLFRNGRCTGSSAAWNNMQPAVHKRLL